MSAKLKILLLIGLLLSSSILIISGVGFFNFKSASTKNSKSQLDNQAFLISKAVDQKMARYFNSLEIMTNDIGMDRNGLLNVERAVESLHIITEKLGVLETHITTKDAKTYTHGRNGYVPGFNAKEKKREWYLRVFNGEGNIITAAYVGNDGGAPQMTLASPVIRNGEILGVLAININVNQITDFINELTPKNQIFVSRSDGYLLSSKDPKLIGDNLYELQPSYKDYKTLSTSNHNYNFENNEYAVASSRIDSLGWTVWSWDTWDSINDASNDNLKASLLMAVIFIFLSLYIVYLIIMKVIYLPIGGEPTEIEAIVKKIAKGDLSSIVSDTGQETGVYKALLTMVGNLKEIIQNINTSTLQLNTSSTQMSDSALSVNSSSQSQMSQLEQTSAAMSQMTVTVDEVARNAVQASSAANEANKHSSLGINVVSSVSTNISTLVTGITDVQQVMSKLESEIENIGGILGVIRGISDQTNLLALNAAIEAARAGEQGRGFSVVADEVRTLANRTQESTSEIQAMINSLQNESKSSVDLMQVNVENAQSTAEKSQEANNALEEIRRSVSIIQDMNNQIATSAEEQTLVAGEINQSIANINDSAKVTLDTSENNTKTATELLAIATALNKSVDLFKL